MVEEEGRKELLRDVGGGQGGEKVERRVSTEQDSNADNSDQYRPGITLRRTCRRMCWTIMWRLAPILVPYKTSRGAKSAL